MSKRKMSIERLIGLKNTREKFMIKDVYVKGLDATITIQKCKFDVVLNAMDQISKNDNVSNMVEVFKELIYKSVPIFQSSEVLAAYQVAEPFDIVTELLELGDIISLGNEILKLHGLDDLDGEIKN